LKPRTRRAAGNYSSVGLQLVVKVRGRLASRKPWTVKSRHNIEHSYMQLTLFGYFQTLSKTF